MDFTARKRLFNRCDPMENLSPDDERNIDVDSISGGVRGDAWALRLARQIEYSDSPAFILFTGLPGSGKSTELRRMASRLSQPQLGNFLTVWVDAEKLIDLNATIDLPDLLANIVNECEKAVLAAEGQSADTVPGYGTRLWTWLTRTDVELNKVEFTIPGGASLTAELMSRPDLRARVRETISRQFSTFVAVVGQELEALNARTKVANRKGLVVIFDSLEKLRGSSESWESVLQSAEHTFTTNAAYLRLPVHVLYTVPPTLVARRQDLKVEFMPMIKVRDQAGQPSAAGVAAMREMAARRLEAAGMEGLFGKGQVEDRLQHVIEMSAGYPRDLVRMLRSCVLASPDSGALGEEAFARVMNEVREGYRLVVTADAFAWLARVHQDRFMTTETETLRKSVELLLLNNAVLRYINTAPWFDVHPAVREIPGVAEEIAKLRQTQSSG